MTGKQIAASIGLSVLSVFAGIGIALMFLQPRTIVQTASGDDSSPKDSVADRTGGKETSGIKVTREEAEAEIDNALKHGRGDMAGRFHDIWRSEFKTLDDFRLPPGATLALAEYGRSMRRYYASGKDKGDSPVPVDGQTKRDAKEAMRVVEKTFPLAAIGCTKALAYLFDNGMDVNSVGDGGYLHFAAAAGKTDMIDFLIGCGADVNMPDKDGQTPLGWVRENRDAKTGYLTAWHLIDRGADLLAGQRHGLRPDGLLYESAKYGDFERVKMLVEKLDVKPQDAKIFDAMLKDASSAGIKAYLEREADRRNWKDWNGIRGQK